MIVADAVAHWLENKGIAHAFAVIGGGNVCLFEAIAKRGFTKIICTHHEQAAAMAATFYYRTCGRLAVCLVTTGAGSSNAITGVLAAWMDSIPLLVIAGNEASRYMSYDTRILGVQGYQSAYFAAPIVKRHTLVEPMSKIEIVLDDALEECLSVRPGPAWVEIPKDIQSAAA